ncbi:TIR domain-containing protein [Chromobacterium amazonense]|uniref:TIR domain-containing protein n=1 Tax=Chromobacterium amazonense TaxID=1382803 RepID=UPI0031F71BC3
MTLDEAKSFLATAGLEVSSEQRANNDLGWQLRLKNGGIVNVFDTGVFNVQGKCQPEVKAALGAASTQAAIVKAAAPAPVIRNTNTKVFVVYGHDETARNHLEAMLRRWGLEPLILDQLPSEGQTIIEKLEKYTSDVHFAVVLATPDDEGNRAGRDDEKAYRARQNVVLELGMLLSRLGRSRVAIILKQQANMERPSDIQGLIYIPFKDDLQKEAGTILAKEMAAQGYHIDIAKL